MGSRGASSASSSKKTKSNSIEIGNGKHNVVSNLGKDIPKVVDALTEAYNSGQRNNEGSKYLTVYVKGAKSRATAGITIRKKGRAKTATYGRVLRGGVVEGNYKTADGVARAIVRDLYAKGGV